MIFIVSNQEDHSTNDVVRWLRYYKIPHQRINRDPEIEELRTLESYLIRDHEYIGTDQASKSDRDYAIWFRRPDLSILDRMASMIALDPRDIQNPVFTDGSSYFHSWEKNLYGYRKAFLHSKFNDTRRVIGSHNINKVNKINVLRRAHDMGLKIPKSIVSKEPDQIAEFAAQCPSGVICKTLYQLIIPDEQKAEHFHISGFTKKIEKTDYNKKFYPSLIQENIEKKYEIRTFILDGKCYSAALWSQSNDSTAQDFRASRTSDNSPRTTQYQLPEEIDAKIIELASLFGLNSCSIDIMRGIDGNYYFLEINPVGQFGFISGCINRQLELKIAHALMNKAGYDVPAISKEQELRVKEVL